MQRKVVFIFASLALFPFRPTLVKAQSIIYELWNDKEQGITLKIGFFQVRISYTTLNLQKSAYKGGKTVESR